MHRYQQSPTSWVERLDHVVEGGSDVCLVDWEEGETHRPAGARDLPPAVDQLRGKVVVDLRRRRQPPIFDPQQILSHRSNFYPPSCRTRLLKANRLCRDRTFANAPTARLWAVSAEHACLVARMEAVRLRSRRRHLNFGGVGSYGQRRRARRTTSAICGWSGGGSMRGSTAYSSTVKSSPSSWPRSSAST
jgi:hypothetical protein